MFPLIRSCLPFCCLLLFCCCLFGILCPCLMSCCLSSLPLCISLSKKHSGPLFLLCFPAFAEILLSFCNWDTGRHTGAHPPLCVSYLFCIWDTSSFCSPCTKKSATFFFGFRRLVFHYLFMWSIDHLAVFCFWSFLIVSRSPALSTISSLHIYKVDAFPLSWAPVLLSVQNYLFRSLLGLDIGA